MKLPSNSDRDLTQLYQIVFNDENGKRVLADLYAKFSGDVADENPYITYYNSGMRAVYLYIEKELNKKL